MSEWKSIRDGNPKKGSYWIFVKQENQLPDHLSESGIYVAYFWIDPVTRPKGYWPGSSDAEGRPLFEYYMHKESEEPPIPPQRANIDSKLII